MENHYPYRNLGNNTKNSAERFPSRILLKIQSMSWCEVSFACGREAAKYNRGREKPLIVCSSEKNGEGNLLARSYLKTPESASQEKVLQFWHCFYCEKGIYFLKKKKKKIDFVINFFSWKTVCFTWIFGSKTQNFQPFLRYSLKGKGKGVNIRKHK